MQEQRHSGECQDDGKAPRDQLINDSRWSMVEPKPENDSGSCRNTADGESRDDAPIDSTVLGVLLSAPVGGIVALWITDAPFSASSGIGFLALFGVSVQTAIVYISYVNELRRGGVDGGSEAQA
jgi:hypothetical protein